jgi:CRISPR/Cas system CSM-associated protein Csm3 (group 7 of RAMP superfamily)
LLSDTVLGRGDGVAGLVNAEVQHDAFGCPFLGGRTIKGLLREECVNLLYALQPMGKAAAWEGAAARLFGEPGSTLAGRSFLYISDATLPDDLRQAIRQGIAEQQLTRAQVLHSLTAIRYQTGVDVETEAPQKESLRAMRVVLRNTVLTAQLYLEESGDAAQEQCDRALLAACIKALRLVGTGRNRGVGEVRAQLQDEQGQPLPSAIFAYFATEVQR